MRLGWYTRRTSGFTIVELLIVMAIIAILATVVVVAYSGAQRRSVETVMRSTLSSSNDAMSFYRFNNGSFPSFLPDNINAPDGVTLTLKSATYPVYSGLGAVQQGVLFRDVCSQLISEGYGVGTNNGGKSEQYITGCNVYGYTAMQINGWDAHDFSVPITATSVRSWYDTNISYDSYRPNHKAVMLAFADELTSRFVAMGGSFPVTSFWDPWAAPGNGGVSKEELPAPDSGSGSQTFCLEARSTKYADLIWHVTESGKQEAGACS